MSDRGKVSGTYLARRSDGRADLWWILDELDANALRQRWLLNAGRSLFEMIDGIHRLQRGTRRISDDLHRCLHQLGVLADSIVFRFPTLYPEIGKLVGSVSL